MRTTVNIDDRLLTEAKKQALESGCTLNRVIVKRGAKDERRI